MAMTHGVEKAQALLGLMGATGFANAVAVLGVGPLGLCHLIKAKLLGAGTLIATDRFPSRLALAREFGATLTMVLGETDTAERLARARALTCGLGPDIVIACSGFPDTFIEALRMVRAGGVVIEAGTFVDMGPVGINPNSDICTKNVSVLGIGGETATSYLPSMRLMAANLGRLPLERIVTHRMPLERAQEAVELAQTDSAMKVVIAPDGVP